MGLFSLKNKKFQEVTFRVSKNKKEPLKFLILQEMELSSLKLEVGLLPSQKNCIICVMESLLKMMKNTLYFILKAFFVPKIFKF